MRLAPHPHAAVRGAIPRTILRQVVAATDYALWWPAFDQPVYLNRIPVWSGPEHGYVDPDTGEVLPTWNEALDRINDDPDAKPAHVMRFGKQLDLQGVIPEHADKAVRYLAKYLTKAVGETHVDPDTLDQAYVEQGCLRGEAVRTRPSLMWHGYRPSSGSSPSTGPPETYGQALGPLVRPGGILRPAVVTSLPQGLDSVVRLLLTTQSRHH